MALAHALTAVGDVLRAVARVLGVAVFGTLGYVLVQSSVRAPLSEALKSADVLVTAVFAVGGWAFARFLDNVNERFNAADEAVKKRFNAVEDTLQELKALLVNPPQRR